MSLIYLLTIVALLAGTTWALQRRFYFLQYLFFIRYPLLAAVVLVALPFVAGDDDPKLIQNWFE